MRTKEIISLVVAAITGLSIFVLLGCAVYALYTEITAPIGYVALTAGTLLLYSFVGVMWYWIFENILD